MHEPWIGICLRGQVVGEQGCIHFRHFIEALVEFFKNGTIPAPHSETLSIISAWGALMEAEKTPGIWVKVPKD